MRCTFWYSTSTCNISRGPHFTVCRESRSFLFTGFTGFTLPLSFPPDSTSPPAPSLLPIPYSKPFIQHILVGLFYIRLDLRIFHFETHYTSRPLKSRFQHPIQPYLLASSLLLRTASHRLLTLLLSLLTG